MALLAKIGFGLLGTAVAGAGILLSQGFVHVQVVQKQENGTHLHLVLPALAVPIALQLVPRHDLAQAAAQVRPWLPAIDKAASVLGNSPDGPLVTVTEPGERVSVAKSGGSLFVDVNDPREHVYVSVPLATLQSAANVLASRAEPD
jgi:hypothetical protein